MERLQTTIDGKDAYVKFLMGASNYFCAVVLNNCCGEDTNLNDLYKKLQDSARRVNSLISELEAELPHIPTESPDLEFYVSGLLKKIFDYRER